ncbi:MAG: TIR domain-containing protein [Acidobacteriota bacterium]
MTVFISYSRLDMDWADRVETMFAPAVRDGAVSLFIDRTNIQPGDAWPSALDEAIEQARVAIVLVTPRALATDFVIERELKRFLERGIPVLALYVEDCDFARTPLASIQGSNDPKFPLLGLDASTQSRAIKILVDQTVAALNREPNPPPASSQPPPEGVHIEIDRLPQGAGTFVGRADEIERLNALWRDRQVHVASLVAWGGVGKTALAQAWLARMARDGYRGATRVYAWSFYSQGTENRVASADDFLLEALAWFGESDPTALSQSERPKRLAALVLASPTLLILDGLEPLQHGPGPQLGKLKEPALRAFLRALASAPAADDASATHLCLLTTRVPVADLDDWQATSFRRIDLQHLAEADGVALLRALGVKGHAHDVKEAVTRAQGHALTLKLVGQYAVDVLDGDVGRPEAVDLLDPEAPEGEHATRVLDAYDAWLGDTAERAIVRLMGLFDRPADAGCVEALRAKPAITGLTDGLFVRPKRNGVLGWLGMRTPEPQPLDDAIWKRTLTRLRRIGLLLGSEDGTLDAHPLVRAHAAARLAREAHAAWQAGHLRLYEHLTRSTTEEQPDTAEGLMPLYQAVVHGCRAGRVQEACDAVYWKRIRRGKEAYSVRKFGLFGSELTAAASFFAEAFTRPHGSLRASDQAWLLNEAGFVLRALGRLVEAEAPMRAGLKLRVEQEVWTGASRIAGNLSELNVTLGALPQAFLDAERAVALADRSGDAFWRMTHRTTLADAHHQLGDVPSASSRFAEVEAMQAERQLFYPLLYSTPGYRYCDLLLSSGDASSARAVIDRAEYTLEVSTRNSWPLDIGLDNLSLGNAWTILAHGGDPAASEPARTHLERAVEGLRASGQEDDLPRGLLARAAYSRLVARDANAANDDLQEVEELADRCGMRLFACDAHLERARLLRDLSEADDARERVRAHVEAANMLIEETGYHRRDGELANLEAWLRGEDPQHDLGAWG